VNAAKIIAKHVRLAIMQRTWVTLIVWRVRRAIPPVWWAPQQTISVTHVRQDIFNQLEREPATLVKKVNFKINLEKLCVKDVDQTNCRQVDLTLQTTAFQQRDFGHTYLVCGQIQNPRKSIRRNAKYGQIWLCYVQRALVTTIRAMDFGMVQFATNVAGGSLRLLVPQNVRLMTVYTTQQCVMGTATVGTAKMEMAFAIVAENQTSTRQSITQWWTYDFAQRDKYVPDMASINKKRHAFYLYIIS